MQNKESRKLTYAALTLIFVIMLMDFIGIKLLFPVTPLHLEVCLPMGVTIGLGSLMNIFAPRRGGFFGHVMASAPYWMGEIILVLAGPMMLLPTVEVQLAD